MPSFQLTPREHSRMLKWWVYPMSAMGEASWISRQDPPALNLPVLCHPGDLPNPKMFKQVRPVGGVLQNQGSSEVLHIRREGGGELDSKQDQLVPLALACAGRQRRQQRVT